MKELAGRVGFVTGGRSGVALGQAKVLAQEAGMKMVIADNRQDHLDEAMDKIRTTNAAVHAVRLDITDRDACRRAADEAERVLPFPEFIPTMEQRNGEVIAALKQYEDHPDYARRMKLRAAQGRPMPGAC